jgi:carbonic anhydrase
MERKNNLKEIVEFNKNFVDSKEYEKYRTTKYPEKSMVILSCMDTRLTELLPKAMNLKNGDAKIIKNAGGLVIHPFGSAMRSILICVYEFDVKEVFIVGHYDCRVSSLNTTKIVEEMKEKGIEEKTLNILLNSGIDVKIWLHGFDCIEESVEQTVAKVKNHPLLPDYVAVHGLIMDPETGKIDVVINGFDQLKNDL